MILTAAPKTRARQAPAARAERYPQPESASSAAGTRCPRLGCGRGRRAAGGRQGRLPTPAYSKLGERDVRCMRGRVLQRLDAADEAPVNLAGAAAMTHEPTSLRIDPLPTHRLSVRTPARQASNENLTHVP